MRAFVIGSRLMAMVVLGAAALTMTPAAAQETATPGADYATASPPDNPVEEIPAPAAEPLTPEESETLSKALLYDPTGIASGHAAKPLRIPGQPKAADLDVSRTENADGSSAIAVKRPLPTAWDAKVGADLNLAPDSYQPGMPLPAMSNDRGSGAAWASVAVPNVGSVDARVDPSSDQGKLGTTIQRSVPIGSRYSVTLQNTLSVTGNLAAAPVNSTYAPMMMAAPPPDPTAVAPVPGRVWGNTKALKLDMLSTGTTFGAGVTTASDDPVTHHTFSADQKIYGGFHVSTSVTDPGQTTSSKSVSAGYKLKW